MQPYDQAYKDVEKIFLRYGPMLYRVAVVMLGNCHDAEDMVQDVLSRYMEHKKDFRDETHEKAWLIRVTVNLCKTRLLFTRKHPQIELSELTAYSRNEEEGHLMEGLLKLSQTYRTVLLLYYVMGYSIRETAQILYTTESAVKKRLERGRKKFREIMEQEGV